MKEGRTALIKSNNPHLAGGEISSRYNPYVGVVHVLHNPILST